MVECCDFDGLRSLLFDFLKYAVELVPRCGLQAKLKLHIADLETGIAGCGQRDFHKLLPRNMRCRKVLAAKVEPDKRIHLDLSAVNACTCVAATTDVSGSFEEIVSVIPDKDNACAIVSDGDSASGTSIPVWYLAEDNNFRMV